MLAHFIFFGGMPFWGIRLLLKLVAIPAATIIPGKLQGVLNKKKLSSAATIVIIVVIGFVTATLDILKAEKAINPKDISWIKLKIPATVFLCTIYSDSN